MISQLRLKPKEIINTVLCIIYSKYYFQYEVLIVHWNEYDRDFWNSRELLGILSAQEAYALWSSRWSLIDSSQVPTRNAEL